MNVLWVTNKIIPAVHNAMNKNATLVNEGWITQMFTQLCNEKDKCVSVVCCGAKENLHGKTRDFCWYTVFESKKDVIRYSLAQKNRFAEIIKCTSPDIIHIWGTEYPHALAMINAAKECGTLDKVVVSIQGLVSYIGTPYYYYAGLPNSVVESYTFRDIIRSSNIKKQQMNFMKRGLYEIMALREVKHAIGRTAWDKSALKIINPDLNYYHCNETLRADFYTETWDYSICKKHSIFVSQATYPLKGIHILFEAMPHILEKYPDAEINVGGYDITKDSNLRLKLKMTSYGRYLRSQINRLGIKDKVHFCGILNSNAIKEKYLQANVFVSCSSLENSSNSIGEAMLLGVPVVSSDVGGVRSIVKDIDECILYRWDEPKSLARAIIDVFDSLDSALERAGKAKEHAILTHDMQKNYNQLSNIYRSILSQNNI